MSDYSVEITNLKKSFGKKSVINGLNLCVTNGDILAFLGLNGSGKTTTIRTILNIYPIQDGEILVFGKKYSSKLSNLIGYLPEERGLYLNSKVCDILNFFGQLKGLSSKQTISNSLEYLKKVGLEDKYNEKIKKLSSGQQQKIQLGISIINKPKLLILDEPFKGLDPINRELFMGIFKELNENGTTIFFSSHQLDDVEKIANSVLILKDGKSAIQGNINKVKESFGMNIIKLNFDGKFIQNKNLFSAVLENNYANITPNDGISDNEILQFLIENKIKIIKFEKTLPSLNQIFINLSKNNE